MTRMTLLLTLLAACAADPMPDPCVQGTCRPVAAPAPGGATPGSPDVSPHPGTVTPVDPDQNFGTGSCPTLAFTAAQCCYLYCTDPAAFQAECAPPAGQCADFVCPLAAGGFVTPGLCTPPASPEAPSPTQSK